MQAGADMRELFGYWLPWHYAGGAVAEHLATREKASLCDLDYMAEFCIKGPGSMGFVQQLLTNGFSTLEVGQVRYTAMCRDDGTMVDDGTLWRLGTEEFVLISGQESDGEWVSAQATGWDVQVTNLTDRWTTLAVQGPKSQALVESLVPADSLKACSAAGFSNSAKRRYRSIMQIRSGCPDSFKHPGSYAEVS